MKIKHIITAILIVLSTASIYAKQSNKFPDWSKKTHSNLVDPNYNMIFSTGEVKRMDLTISNEDWSAMWEDLSENLGGGNPPMMGGEGDGPGGPGAPQDVDFTPIYAPCKVTYNGLDWYNVGVRFKGNSSLMRAHTDGSKKLSMKLDFDEYEDLYPDLKNQRFYGFKQLNLNSNFNDTSFIKEIVASDLLRSFGLTAARCTPCELYIDFGEGAQYYGLYTIVEEVDDSVIKSQFADDSGNIYKPEERAGSFAEGTFETSEFHLKNNRKDATYSDVEALYTLLHSAERTSNLNSWMDKLEAIFDVDIFLKWLAVNSTIQNWDTYGNMAHNYFLYNNPKSGKLTWIPWDHNEAFQSQMNVYNPSQLGSIGEEWPLISYIISIEEYRERYNNYLREFNINIFTASRMSTIYDNYYNLLKESIYREVSARTYMRYYKAFDQSISALKDQVTDRNKVVEEYLANPSLIEALPSHNRGGHERMPFGEHDMERRPPMEMEGDRPMMMGRGERGERGMPPTRPTIVEGEALPMESDGNDAPNNFMGRRGNIPTN